MKNMVLIVFVAILSIGNSLGVSKLDSLWNVWLDENNHDTIRLSAIGDYAWSGYLFTQPDSAFYFAQLQLNLAKELENKEWQATALNTQGASFYVKGDYDEALKYYHQSLVLHEEIKDENGIASCLGNIGVIYELQGNYVKAIDYYNRCLTIMEKIDNKSGVANVLNNIGIIYDLQKNYTKAIEYYEKSLGIQEELNNRQGISGALNNLGGVYANQNMHKKAIKYYVRSKDLQEEIGNNKGVANALSNIGESYNKLGDFELAKEYFLNSIKLEEELKNKKGLANTLNKLGGMYESSGEYNKAIELSSRALDYAKAIGAVVHIRDASMVLYSSYKNIGENGNSLKMYELYIKMRDSIESDENQQEIIKQEFKYEYEKAALADSLDFAKKEAVKDLEIEKQEANINKQRIALISSIGGVLLLLLLVFFIQKGKKRSDELLLNILPEETAAELKSKGYAEAKLIETCTVLFTDIKGFTSHSQIMEPNDLVNELNDCFSAYDEIMEKFNVEKIKTIGDAYMAVGGVPSVNNTHAKDVVLAAFEIVKFMKTYSNEQLQLGKSPFEVRIGIHTGPVVAGIVGLKKFQYDIWGDTVNTASRVESSGEIGKINLSESTYNEIKNMDEFVFEDRGKIVIKGKEAMKMYFVEIA